MKRSEVWFIVSIICMSHLDMFLAFGAMCVAFGLCLYHEFTDVRDLYTNKNEDEV